MIGTFEQKVSWAKAFMDGEFVPVPKGLSRSIARWHDRVGEWARVLSELRRINLVGPKPRRQINAPSKIHTRAKKGNGSQLLAFPWCLLIILVG